MQGVSNIDDFDFLIGKWKVVNKRLKERLVGNDEWIEFSGELEVRKTLNGYANVDEYKTEFNGEEFHAVTVRVFNPDEKIWSIYWLDTFTYELIPQVKGNFENGIGEFYGEELFKEKIVKLKFSWTKTSDTLAHWNQAYFDEAKKEWEINWTMDFYRKEN